MEQIWRKNTTVVVGWHDLRQERILLRANHTSATLGGKLVVSISASFWMEILVRDVPIQQHFGVNCLSFSFNVHCCSRRHLHSTAALGMVGTNTNSSLHQACLDLIRLTIHRRSTNLSLVWVILHVGTHLACHVTTALCSLRTLSISVLIFLVLLLWNIEPVYLRHWL